MNLLRLRNLRLFGGGLAVILFLIYTDPDGGSLTWLQLGVFALPIISVLFAHLMRKALFDYLDLETLYNKAKESSIGAGMIFIGVCIVIYGLLGVFGKQVQAQNVETYIPQNATTYISTLKIEQNKYWPTHPKQNS